MSQSDTSSISAWTAALLLAAILNLAIFGLMPRLQSRSGMTRTSATIANRIDVVRIKQPDAPVPKRAEKRPPPPKKLAPHRKQPSPMTQAPVEKLELPFEINPQLPSYHGTLALPPMAIVPLEAPGFKAEYGLSELDHPLTPLVRVPPIYPLHAKRRGIEGSVRVSFRVTGHGQIEDIRIIEAEPEKVFDQSVIRCVSAWRFKPGMYQGRAVSTRVETTIRFELK